MEEKEQIILGSGNVHIETFSGTVPDPTEFCKETNRMAYISGGATLEYKPSYYTAKDDSGSAYPDSGLQNEYRYEYRGTIGQALTKVSTIGN